MSGPEPDLEHGLGRGGEPLHTWAVDSSDDVDAEVLREAVEASGAVVMGRRLFDIVDGPHGWSDEMGYGAGMTGTPPFYVVTHTAPESVRLGLRFSFVTDGLESAIDQARSAAGSRDVFVMGGGDVVCQCVDGGLADELRIHLAPILLGSGTPVRREQPTPAHSALGPRFTERDPPHLRTEHVIEKDAGGAGNHDGASVPARCRVAPSRCH